MEEKRFNNPETLKILESVLKFSKSETKILRTWSYIADLKSLDLSIFPLINDFTVRLIDTEIFGKQVDYFSPKEGVLTSFPWWDNVDMDIKNWTVKNIPLGTAETPFDDLEQGWQVLIFQDGIYVYILEGDEPGCEEFSSWYKVSLEKYTEEWQKVLDLRD